MIKAKKTTDEAGVEKPKMSLSRPSLPGGIRTQYCLKGDLVIPIGDWKPRKTMRRKSTIPSDVSVLNIFSDALAEGKTDENTPDF